MSGEIQRDLGRAEGRLTGLERSLEEIKDSLDRQGERLGRIETKLSETKGGVRVLVGVGTVAGAVGAFLAKIAPHIPFGK